ncbi:hypothetical protein QZH41_002640 [Actinostola sp. cb2023]|nr:hypothetical protein QZH41_002640 [Actinostola sp. cb2023]
MWYIDGTFKLCRHPFTQLFTINIFVRKDDCAKQVPMVFVLMSGRKSKDYKKVLQAINEALPVEPAGFVQPDVIVSLLNGNDYDGFRDRQIFVCPPELDVDYDELVKPPPPTTPQLHEIFQALDEFHRQSDTKYELSKEAHTEFVAYHDQLNERKRQHSRRERDRKSILSKAKGQVARLAAVTYALSQAAEKVKDPESFTDEWSYEIPTEFMTMAVKLMDYCIERKGIIRNRTFHKQQQ